MTTRILASLAVALAMAPLSVWSADPPQGPGLSKEEAMSIATRYFANEIAIEGGVGEPTLQGDNWVFPVKFGARAVVARDPLLVNRSTGKVSWAGLDAHNAALGRAKQPPAK